MVLPVTARVSEEKLIPNGQYFPSAIVQALPHFYAIENAHEWVRFDKFNSFVLKKYQADSPAKPITPRKRDRSTSDASIDILSSPLANRKGSKRPHLETASTMGDLTTEKGCDSVSPIIISSDPSLYIPSTPSRSVPHQNRPITRQTAPLLPSDDPILVSDLPEASQPAKKTRRRGRKGLSLTAQRKAAGWIQITSATWVKRLITVTKLPENWSVSADADDPVGYLVDLSGNGVDYRNDNGTPMSMSAIIRNAVSFNQLSYEPTHNSHLVH